MCMHGVLRGDRLVLSYETCSHVLPVVLQSFFTAPYNNMRTLKFKAQPTNAFFATVNQMFGGSSQLPTTAERVGIKSNCLDNIVRSWEEPLNT